MRAGTRGRFQGFAWALAASLPASFGCRAKPAPPISVDPTDAKNAPPPAEPTPRKATVLVESIYDGGLKGGWEDGGWGVHDLKSGPASIRMDSFGGWVLNHAELAATFGNLTFRVRGPSNPATFLRAALGGKAPKDAFPPFDVAPAQVHALPDGWFEVAIPLSTLDPSSVPFAQVTLTARRLIGATPVEFDGIGFTAADQNEAGVAVVLARRVTITADCVAPSHAISPYIYGVGGGDHATEGATARRWGGNAVSRYNWQRNTSNLASDWYFENVTWDFAPSTHASFVNDNRAHGLQSAITVPILGWVAKDGTSSGFPVSVLGAQKSTDEHRPNAGNGLRANGSKVTPGPPTTTSVAAPPEFIGRWVASMRADDEAAGPRNVDLYILDNEPSLWSTTHRDVHPEPESYDELLDRTLRYASAIRAADPKALIAGPAEWGWSGYFYSAKDSAISVRLRPDRRAHGDLPLIPWYLQQLSQSEKSTGTKLLDVLDVHFYPQGDKIYSEEADDATAARRIRSTRALWDPNYKDESWIDDNVRLLPRLKEWVAQYYPGLAISIGEYNFGGEKHMSGGLALAEALGQFGKAGIGYAFYWTTPPPGSPAAWAFQAFRNFDGKGAHFLERSVATNDDDEAISTFASRDASGKHLVLVALNTNPSSAARATLKLGNCGRAKAIHTYRYEAKMSAIADGGAVPAGLSEVEFPAYSINVFDVALE